MYAKSEDYNWTEGKISLLLAITTRLQNHFCDPKTLT